MNGSVGWGITAGAVIAWDLLADETMSSAFERACKRRRTRPIVVASWAVLTAHLFGTLPERVDPFHVFLKTCKRAR